MGFQNFEEPYITKKPSFVGRVFNNILGYPYFYLEKYRESVRVGRYNRLNRIAEQKVGFEFARVSKGLFFALLISIFLSWAIDLSLAWILNLSRINGYFYNLNSVLANLSDFLSSVYLPQIRFTPLEVGFIQEFVTVSIGAISALIGLIFALYAVGFQLTTDKYSSEVSDYINNEKVGNFFFKLLIFTDVFLLYVLLEIKIFNIYPLWSFLLCLVLVSLSMFGILIFKDSYLTGLKPRSLFRRLLQEARDYIKIATNRRGFSFHSVSVIYHARESLRKTIDLLGALYEDLKRNKNWNDSVYAPLGFSQILVGYIEKKKYIDRDRGWWFFQKYKEVKANNSTSLTLKLNYELKGTGPLNLASPDEAWVEDHIVTWFKQFNQDVEPGKEKEKFTLQLVAAYQAILFGEYRTDNEGRSHKATIGAYGNQEFDTFNKFRDLFFDLFDKIDHTNEEIVTNYCNTFFAISQSILDGFDYEILEKLIPKIVGTEGQLLVGRSFVESQNLPAKFYERICDYYERLEVENYIEGKVITPIEILKKEIIDGLKKEEADQFVKQIEELAAFQEKMARVLVSYKNYKAIALLIRLRLEWFSRLVYLDKLDLAEKYAYLIPKLGGYIGYLPREVVAEFDFQLQIEKVIFTARLENKQTLFNELLKLLILLILVLNGTPSTPATPSELEQRIKRNRIFVILGGFVYLVAEFEQKREILIDYVKMVEQMFKEGFFAKFVETLADVKGMGLSMNLKLIEAETSRYHHWFGNMHWKVDQLPKTYDYVDHYSGMHEVADHPSKFIRNLSYGINFHEETIIEAFSEWVQKRDAVKTLTSILKQRP